MSEKEVLMRDFKHAYAAIPDASTDEDGNGCKANADAGHDLESLAGQPSERKADSNRWRLFAACTALSCLALLVFLSAGEQRVDPSSLEMGATPAPKTPSPYPNIVHPDPPTSLWGNVQRPYPTGAPTPRAIAFLLLPLLPSPLTLLPPPSVQVLGGPILS
jgi:hypothetical protein